jgi:2-dehydro-3-deoxygluconokinase
VSALPDSPLGRRVVSGVRAGRRRPGRRALVGGRLATYYVEYAVPPRSIQVWFDRRDSCFSRMTPSEVDWAYLLDTRLLHLTGITLALPGPQALVLEAAARAREAGVPVSFDMNYRARLWSPEEARRVALPLWLTSTCSAAAATTRSRCWASRRRARGGAARDGFGDRRAPRRHVDGRRRPHGLGPRGRHDHHVPAREVVILDRIGAGDAMVAACCTACWAATSRAGCATAPCARRCRSATTATSPNVDADELERLGRRDRGQDDRAVSATGAGSRCGLPSCLPLR